MNNLNSKYHDMDEKDAAHLLSVCIPTYNRADYLDQCLAALVPQAEALGIKIFVSDNESADNTQDVVAKYKARYSGIISVRQNSIRKKDQADNHMFAAIGMVDSEFTWLLGDDDIIMDGALEKVLHALQANPDCELMLLNAMLTDNNMRPRDTQFRLDHDHNIVIKDCNELLKRYSDKLTFGMIVINARLFNNTDANRFIGTAHFYGGCIYEYLALNFIRQRRNSIRILKEPMVYLRQGERRWTRETGDITIRQIPMFYTLLHPLYKENARLALKSVTGSYRILYSMIQFRADGWMDATYAAELIKYYKGTHQLRLLIISHLPIILAIIIRKIGYFVGRGIKTTKRFLFNLKTS